MSLQLEAIFPITSRTVTTDDDVLGVLSRLPKNLPEAFDQALSRITDQRYGNRIFQLVAVAVTPLTGEQLKVALSVTPGHRKWNRNAMMRDSPRQLVVFCGGYLIETDEEDGRVRFIHHSVLSHLESSPQLSSNSPETGWLREAECHMGDVCLAYLHLPELESRITVYHGDAVNGHGPLFQHSLTMALDGHKLTEFFGYLRAKIFESSFRIRESWLDDIVVLWCTVQRIEGRFLRALRDFGAGYDFNVNKRRLRFSDNRCQLIGAIIENLCKCTSPPTPEENEIFDAALAPACSPEFSDMAFSEKGFDCLLNSIRWKWVEMTRAIVFNLSEFPNPHGAISSKLLTTAIEIGNPEMVEVLMDMNLQVTELDLLAARKSALECHEGRC